MPDAPVNARVVPGWYGKIPSLGDFASRRLPEAFVQRWDTWLQEGLAVARTELGAGWLDVYLVAPVRRFWLAPGLLGASAWSGVMMSSVDRVGRYFPLTIAQPAGTLADAFAAAAWHAELEGVARQVLDVSFTVDDLEEALAAVTPLDCIELHGNGADADNGGSVWWCADPPQLQRHPGMPSADAFVSLLGCSP